MRRLEHFDELGAGGTVERAFLEDFGGHARIAGTSHCLPQVAVPASDHVEVSDVDYDVTPDRNRAQGRGNGRGLRPQRQPPLTAAQHENAPTPRVAHRDEVGRQFLEAPGVSDRVAADGGETTPCSIRQHRGAVSTEEGGLTRLHRERRQRISMRCVDQGPLEW